VAAMVVFLLPVIDVLRVAANHSFLDAKHPCKVMSQLHCTPTENNSYDVTSITD